MPKDTNLVHFFNKHTDVKEPPHTRIKLEVNGCKIEMEVTGDQDSIKTRELLETCIRSTTARD